MGPSLGWGLSLCSYQCVGGGAAGASPTRLELPYGRAGFPIRLGLLQGMGWVSPTTQGAGWFGAFPISSGAARALCSSPPYCLTQESHLVPSISLCGWGPAQPTLL